MQRGARQSRARGIRRLQHAARALYRIRDVAGFFAGLAGGLHAINYEIVSADAVSAQRSGTVLIMAYIGGAAYFVGPILGAIVITWLQSSSRDYTSAWLLYLGVFFIAMILYAPSGGIAGLIVMHRPIAQPAGARRRAGRIRRRAGAAGADGGRRGSWRSRWPIACRRSPSSARGCACYGYRSMPLRPGHGSSPRSRSAEDCCSFARRFLWWLQAWEPRHGAGLAMAAACALELRGVAKRFGATEIIRGVSLEIARGERHAIIGPNGAGKSTLFNLISGRYAPTRGSIRLDGEEIAGARPFAINRRGLARSFQVTNIFPRLSVFENLRCSVLWSLGYRYNFWRNG